MSTQERQPVRYELQRSSRMRNLLLVFGASGLFVSLASLAVARVKQEQGQIESPSHEVLVPYCTIGISYGGTEYDITTGKTYRMRTKKP